MSPTYKTARKYFQFPILFGGMLVGAYAAFSNRYYLLGDLEPSRAALYQENKEDRALLEEAIRKAKES